MNSFVKFIVIALVCLVLGFFIGKQFESRRSYHFKTIDAPVKESGRGIGQLTGFFKEDSPWLGGYSKTNGQKERAWCNFYNKDGDKEGPSISYWPAGNVRVVTHYRAGKKHGPSFGFSESGNLITMYHYEDGDVVEGSEFRMDERTEAKNEFYEKLEKSNRERRAEY